MFGIPMTTDGTRSPRLMLSLCLGFVFAIPACSQAPPPKVDSGDKPAVPAVIPVQAQVAELQTKVKRRQENRDKPSKKIVVMEADQPQFLRQIEDLSANGSADTDAERKTMFLTMELADILRKVAAYNVPTMNEIPLKKVPSFSYASGRHDLWVRGFVGGTSALL